jgi:hypothetical protein
MSPILGIWASAEQNSFIGSYESIARTTVTTDSTINSITFSSIPSTYSHLQLRIIARSQRSATSDTLYMRYNSDSSNNYSQHTLIGNGSAASATGYYPENVSYSGTIAGNTATTGVFGVSIIDILDYSNTNKYKTTRILDGYDNNGSGTINLRSSNWGSTSALSTIFIANYTNGDFFKAGSSFALYGIKG